MRTAEYFRNTLDIFVLHTMYFHGRRFLPDFFFEKLFSPNPGNRAGSTWNGAGGYLGGSGIAGKRFFGRFGYENGHLRATNWAKWCFLGKIGESSNQKPRSLNGRINNFMCGFGRPKGLVYWAGGSKIEIHYAFLKQGLTFDQNLGFGGFPP